MLKISENEITRDWGEYDVDKPAVTIRCITYNHEHYISQCLDGFLMQKTNFPFEVIVHDDASTDKTADIIREYEKKYPNIIKPIYQTENQYSKKNGSIGRIINSKIKGKYIALCEGDDFWSSSEKLQRQYDIMVSHPECTISYCYVRFADVNGKALKYIAPPKKYLKAGIVTLKDFMNVEFRKDFWCFHTSSFFFRTDIYFRAIEAYNNEFKNFPYGDMPIQLYALIQGNGYLVDLEQGSYRTMSGGYNSNIKKNPKLAIKHQEKLIMALNDFDEYTKYKYHKYIQYRIIRAEMQIKMIECNDKRIESKLMLSPKYFKVTRMKKKIKAAVYLTCPSLYHKLKNRNK